MAIKGLKDLLTKFKNGELNEESFEGELNKALPEDWIPKHKFNEVSEAKKIADDKLKEQDKLLKEIQTKANLSDDYKSQIDKLNAENAKKEEDFKNQIARMKKDTAIDNALLKAKARNSKSVKALLDDSKIVLADNGEIAGLNEQLDAIKKENGFLFESDDKGGNGGGSDPRFIFGGGNGGSGGSGGDSLMAQMFAAAGLDMPK